MIVYQDDYEDFYDGIMDLLEYYKTGRSASLAACPKPKNPYQPTGYQISLNEMKFGKFIDDNYKTRYIAAVQSNNKSAVGDLQREIAKVLQSKEMGLEIQDTISQMIASRNSFFQPKRKKTLWEKIAEFFD